MFVLYVPLGVERTYDDMAVASGGARGTVATPKIFERKINVVPFWSVEQIVWTSLILPLNLFTADSLVLIDKGIFEENPFGDIID